MDIAKPGDKILFANYGDGADAYVLQVTDQIEKVRNRRGIKRHLDSKMTLSNYGVYLQMRNVMEWAPNLRPPRRSPLSSVWRDRKMFYALYGQKCNECGHIIIVNKADVSRTLVSTGEKQSIESSSTIDLLKELEEPLFPESDSTGQVEDSSTADTNDKGKIKRKNNKKKYN